MFEGLRFLVSDRSFLEIVRDLVDILIVAFIIYRGLLVLKGTRAMQMGLGFVAFGVLYLVAKYADLATLQNVLSWVASSAILITVVVFQNDIRRALIRVGSKAWLMRGRDAQIRVIDEVVAAAKELARHRMGALICFERDANVLEFVKNDGIELDSMVTRELLVSLFIPESVNKTHDGAVLIRDLRISHAGLFFPMPESTRVADPTLGSRHRAAIGITEETDSVVVAVSEERGTITLVFKDGTMVPNLTEENLRNGLLGLFGRDKATTGRQPLMKRVASGLALGGARAAAAFKPDAAKAKADKPKPEKKAEIRRPSEAASKAEPKREEEPAKPESKKDDKPDKDEAHISRPPSAGTPRTPGPAALDKKTKRSGGFKAVKREEGEAAVPPRVSVPMPSPKDRKSEESPPPRASSPPRTSTAPRASTPPPTSVSKPMTPTELPTTIGSDDT